jgi:hypothetical protein
VRDLAQQGFDEIVLDAGACLFGRFGDGHPQLPVGHRGDQVAVLDRVGQLRVVGAAGFEIGPHTQHNQRGRVSARRGGAARVQGGHECPALLLVGALGEQLLELIDHQQQPMLRRRPRSLPVRRRHSTLGEGGLPRGEGEPGRIGL